MELFIEQVFNGIGNGVVYGSVALALVLISYDHGRAQLRPGRDGAVLDLHPWKLTTEGMPVVGAIAVSMVIAFIAGAAIERTLIRPVETARSPLNVVIVTLGLFLALNSLSQLSSDRPAGDAVAFPAGSTEILTATVQQKETIGLIVVLLLECAFFCGSCCRGPASG